MTVTGVVPPAASPIGTRSETGAVLVRFVGVTLGYAHRTVLRNVDLTIGRSEFWFLVGPNGSGKSTLLRATLGLLPPLGGRISLHPAIIERRAIGFVPQECGFSPSLPTTVREFVALGLVGLGLTRAERAALIIEALERVQLQDAARRDLWSLSGGQRQRALVARALVRKPELLVLDEPTSGLDLGVEHRLMQLLAELNQHEKLTIVCVTHDLNAAGRYGSHVALLHDGIVETIPPLELCTGNTLDRLYQNPTPNRFGTP